MSREERVVSGEIYLWDVRQPYKEMNILRNQEEKTLFNPVRVIFYTYNQYLKCLLIYLYFRSLIGVPGNPMFFLAAQVIQSRSSAFTVWLFNCAAFLFRLFDFWIG